MSEKSRSLPKLRASERSGKNRGAMGGLLIGGVLFVVISKLKLHENTNSQLLLVSSLSYVGKISFPAKAASFRACHDDFRLEAVYQMESAAWR